ncbi:MAG: hypothetical protein VKJ64_12585 [Leptolyngbyaceae bacterium]|nr:hypothetical protein [Leptolyngbyaceae bacterium]
MVNNQRNGRIIVQLFYRNFSMGSRSPTEFNSISNSRRLKQGTCPFCQRQVSLTFHPLTPKKVHGRPYFKKNFSKAMPNQGVDICRLCHRGIHRHYDEMVLAKLFNSLEVLLADGALRQHFDWVAKQKVRSHQHPC